jgi:hypothetical protein|tara:strand:- start:1383 stop:1619 length:237 start_codon:yes stop_codon:yes gene_type:complete
MKRINKEDIVLNIIGMISAMAALFFMSSLFFMTSCSDDTFILGYNKDLEEIHQSIFEVDSLMRAVTMEWDSLEIELKK